MTSFPRIVFGVTVDYSIKLLGKIPEELAKDGWDVHVVSAPGIELDALEKAGSVTYHRLPMEREPRISKDFRSLLRWIKTLRAIDPDVVSIGTPKASLLGLAAAWLLRVPARVYFLRGLRLETSIGLERFALRISEKLAAGFATHIVSVSPSLREVYLDNNLTNPDKITVLGHGSSKGVNLKRFRPARPEDAGEIQSLGAEVGLRAGVPVVGLVGRQNVDKGLSFFTDALRHPAMAGVKYQVLVIGGDEASGLLSRLLQESQSYSVFIDNVSDVERYFHLMTVLCLPTQREGLPNVVLEALASGTPVITTDATGARDSIENGVTGIQVARDDAEALAKALKEVLTNASLRDKLSSNSRPWVQNRFSEKLVIPLHKAFYENALLKAVGGPDGK
jgi:glycosyltransferase involved in cell wall biosynthesis